MTISTSQSPALYRIGAVSKLSGIPVPTLRIWQTRYKAFSPTTSHGQHRLYSEDDVRKAALLKSLTRRGHGISLVASLPTAQLQQLLHTSSGMAAAPSAQAASSDTGTWVVIGQPLAQRLRSETLASASLDQILPIAQVWADLDEASRGQLDSAPNVLMVSVNGLNESNVRQIQALAQQHAARQTVVLYSFGQINAVASLRRAGCLVHQVPLNDMALADIIQRARPALHAPAWTLDKQNSEVPARQFSDAVLQRVANNPNQVRCECPRHVAELVGQLGRFEDYSRDCLNQSPKDAELHTQLNIMAATARALLEKALHMVATHEGISLQEPLA